MHVVSDTRGKGHSGGTLSKLQARAPAVRGLQQTPSAAERLVGRLERSATLRLILIAAWLAVTTVGVLLFFSPTLSFAKGLDINIRPPPASLSGRAKVAYAEFFDPPPMQVAVEIASADGSSLLNTSLKGHWLFGYQDASATQLTGAAAAASHALRDLGASVLDGRCDYRFLSYWDLLSVTNKTRLDLVGRAEHFAARVAEPTLFSEARGSDTTLALVSIKRRRRETRAPLSL